MMADEGIEIPVNLDINDAEREMAKLQKEIGRKKIRLEVEIGKKGELQKKLAENAAKADVLGKKVNSGLGTAADAEALRQSEMEWTSINRQIRDVDASIRSYQAGIEAASAEWQRLAAATTATETRTNSIKDAFANFAQQAAVPIRNLQNAVNPVLIKFEQLGNGSAFLGMASALNNNVGTALDAAKAKASALADKIKELGQPQYEGKRVAPTSFLDTISNGVEAAKAKLQSLRSSISGVLDQAGDGDKFAGVFVMAQTAILNAEAAVKRLASSFNEATNASGILKSGIDAVKESIKGLGDHDIEPFKHKWETALEKLRDSAKKAGASLKSMVGGAIKKGLSSLGKGLSSLGSSIKNAAKSFLGLDKNSRKANGGLASGLFTVIKYAFSIRSLYMLVRKLKTALVDGFKNLAQFSTQTNADISMVMSALTQLKNSLATAFAPILTVIAPLVTKFINMMSAAATAVARLTAQLTGKTSFVKATSVQQDYAKSLNNTASSAGSAADAAKEANKTLASFDEINKLDAPSSSSGGGGSGGGGGGSGVGDMFTTEQIEPLNFDSWGAAFSAFLDKLINDGIPMLKNALTSLASWINDFAANLAEMFTFPGVYEKVVLLGTEVGQALNDFVSQINWGDIGTALGAGFNLALSFLVNAIYTFDFLNLGSSLATMVNNAVQKVDWYALGQFLFAKFKWVIETAAGFLLNLDMPLLAQSASDIAIGFFDSVSETIASIDWGELGHQVATFLENIKWSDVATSCFTAIGSAFGAAVAFLWGLIDDAWEAVVNWWHETAFEDGEFTITGLLNGIVEVLKGIGSWINKNIFQPFWKGIKSAFGIASPSKKMAELGNFMTEGLLQGVKQKISAIIQTFSGLWSSIKGVFGSVSSWFSNTFSGAWQAVKDVFSTGGAIFEGIKEGILSGLKSVVNALIRGINKVIAVPFNGLNSALRSIKRVSILGLKPFSWLPTISVPQIPQLAQGAVIPPNKEFLAVLGDQKNGTNIETPLSTMVQAFKQALNENGGSGDVYIYLDSEQIAARVEKRQRQKAIRTNGAVKSYA